MKKLIALFVIFAYLAPGAAFAQSLKQENPYPLKAGINKGTTDCFVGPHYWYFVGGPGSVKIQVHFKSMALFGNAQRTPLTVTLFDGKGTKITQSVMWSTGAVASLIQPGTLKSRTKIVICVAPPDHALVRQGGDYDIEVTGAVAFGETRQGDPVVQTYSAMTHVGAGNFGATRFLANGTIECSDGSKGTWKLFDPDNHIYKVTIQEIEGPLYTESLKFVPGRGLCGLTNDIIAFQQLK